MRLAALLLLALAPAFAQDDSGVPGAALRAGVDVSPRTLPITPRCEWISRHNPQFAPLAQLCESAQNLHDTLPDFICDQRTERTMPVPYIYADRPAYRKGSDVVTAEVTYTGGQERFDNVLVDGRPADPSLAHTAMWSEGEFGPLVLTALNEHSAPRITFRGEVQEEGAPALVFDYSIESKNNLSWQLRISRVDYRPDYHGSIWIDKATGHLRRLTQEADKIPRWVGYTAITKSTEYAPVDIAGLGQYVLPVRSRAVGCERDMEFCSVNVLTFHDCRKFAARTKIVTDDPEP